METLFNKITTKCLVRMFLMKYMILSLVDASSNMSSTLNNGRKQICPGELISYRCITDGLLLAWSLPPLVNTSSAILFDSTSEAEIVRTRVDGEVLAVLALAGTPVFDSVLTIKPTVNVSQFTVNCITGENNLFSVYKIATTPPKINGLTLEEELNKITWNDAPNTVELAFYEVKAFVRNSSIYQIFQAENASFYVDFETYDSVEITVEDKCGQRSEITHINLNSTKTTNATNTCPDTPDSISNVEQILLVGGLTLLLTSIFTFLLFLVTLHRIRRMRYKKHSVSYKI